MVQWLRLRASIAGGTGSIPDLGTKILHVAGRGQKKKKKGLGLNTFCGQLQLQFEHLQTQSLSFSHSVTFSRAQQPFSCNYEGDILQKSCHILAQIPFPFQLVCIIFLLEIGSRLGELRRWLRGRAGQATRMEPFCLCQALEGRETADIVWEAGR